MKVSINDALGIIQQLATRLKQVEAMKDGVKTRNVFKFAGTPDRTEEPIYSIKLVDVKSVKLTNAISTLNRAVKSSNAITMADVDINLDDLMSPIE